MSELDLKVATTKSGMEEIRPELDAALGTEFPGGMLKSSWQDDVLHLTGPGASGTIVFRDGELIGSATLKPPASMMKPVIEKKILAAMKAAAD